MDAATSTLAPAFTPADIPAPAMGTALYHKGMTAAQMQGTARQFEAMFISQMLQPMFAGLTADPAFGGGEAENQWRSMMVDEYGKSVAAHGGFGIADAVMKVMIHAQEQAQGDTAAAPATTARPGKLAKMSAQAVTPARPRQETLQ